VLCATLSTGLIFFAQAVTAVINTEPIGDASVSPELVSVLIFLLIVSYFTGAWAVTGRTPGEALMGLRVIRPNGKRLRFLRSLVRCFVGLASLAVFFLGYLWILVDSRRRSWPDLVARTVVIYDWEKG
jgi:uncharacterized RDD family membrane protein YckC